MYINFCYIVSGIPASLTGTLKWDPNHVITADIFNSADMLVGGVFGWTVGNLWQCAVIGWFQKQ